MRNKSKYGEKIDKASVKKFLFEKIVPVLLDILFDTNNDIHIARPTNGRTTIIKLSDETFNRLTAKENCLAGLNSQKRPLVYSEEKLASGRKVKLIITGRKSEGDLILDTAWEVGE